jgi:hypothetical protein
LGLVLSSLISLDDREDRYRKIDVKREQRKEGGNRPAEEAQKPKTNLFSGIISRTKTFLADDVDTNNNGF